MADLTKLFVLVPSGTTFDGTTVTKLAANAKKVFFEVDTNTIWNNGVAYGISAELAAKITANETAIGKLQTLIGASEKAEGVDDILTRLAAVETATSKPVGIADGEKVLAMDTNNKLSSTLSLAIEKKTVGSASVDCIVLKGKDDAEVAYVDASTFVKDGMIDSIAWSTETGKENVLVVTWNTDAGKTAVEIDMTKFIDTYTSGNTDLLGVEGYVITPKVGEFNSDGTVKTAGLVTAELLKAQLDGRAGDYATAAQGVKADTAVQAVATGDTNGTIKVDGTEVAVKGLGSAAYTDSDDYATAVQGTTAESALQSVTILGKELTKDASTMVDSDFWENYTA